MCVSSSTMYCNIIRKNFSCFNSIDELFQHNIGKGEINRIHETRSGPSPKAEWTSEYPNAYANKDHFNA